MLPYSPAAGGRPAVAPGASADIGEAPGLAGEVARRAVVVADAVVQRDTVVTCRQLARGARHSQPPTAGGADVIAVTIRNVACRTAPVHLSAESEQTHTIWAGACLLAVTSMAWCDVNIS